MARGEAAVRGQGTWVKGSTRLPLERAKGRLQARGSRDMVAGTQKKFAVDAAKVSSLVYPIWANFVCEYLLGGTKWP